MAEPEPEPELEPVARVAQPTRITLQLCQEAIFPDYHIESLRDSDRLTQQLFETTKLRLNDMAIQEIENLEMFTALECLYLHHNQIRVIENMEFHPNLRVLSISNNQIEELSGLLCLTRLEYLNASANKIAHVDEAELPPSLVHLNLSNNPAAWEEDYRQRLIGALPALEDLDAVDVTPAELEAYGCAPVCSCLRDCSISRRACVHGSRFPPRALVYRFEVSDDEDDEGERAADSVRPVQTEPLRFSTRASGALASVDEDQAGVSRADAVGTEDVDFDAAEGGEVDFASRYSRVAIDIPTTLDSMTEGIMDGFRARRQELTEASRHRQQELKQQVIAADATVAAQEVTGS
jgi:hypothetical protein